MKLMNCVLFFTWEDDITLSLYLGVLIRFDHWIEIPTANQRLHRNELRQLNQ